PAAEPGTRRQLDLAQTYIARVASGVKLARPMKIAIDCGNGVAGAVAPQLFSARGCEVDELFCDGDGNFPNNHPDPAEPKNL
ncbi:phosphomannomutase/phosphoglucomutase, partial [Paenibacillus polymyxa]|nr:phosphomannomutase/phosphoglucomutase [Paenibacillus polymyxa]